MNAPRVLILLTLAIAGAAALASGWHAAPTPQPASATPTTDATTTSFAAFDVIVDSRTTPLAAYQVEIALPQGIRLVGIEGGERPFADAPAYDPRALHESADVDRVVLAAIVRDDAPPTGTIRVARLHVMVTGSVADTPDALTTRLIAAGADEHTRTTPDVRTTRFVPAPSTPAAPSPSDAHHPNAQEQDG